ncbi:ATP-binding protein [Jannaschia sp. LMIT008]|uniref:ATP-binding protein n=1 Tax=Jannaschia maritima TaxID=3032585 RepID=UPI002811D636|nr:ATP-binding protein [Jannaschia sp. LMIT008]
MIEPIDDTHEELEVHNFLSIKKATLQLANITAIIGPQASGKSVVAKLFYFGRTYLSSYFNMVYVDEYDTRTFKRRQVEEFLSIFGGLDDVSAPFSITYRIDDLVIFIERRSEGGKPRLKHSKSLDGVGQRLRREFIRYGKLSGDEDKRRVTSTYEFRRAHEEVQDFFRSIPQVLFVPASRSFYSTVSEELFTFLASDERVDPLTAQFGSFYEFAKRRISGEFHGIPDRKRTLKVRETIEPVIDGNFVRVKSRDYIETRWGRVPLRSASSGQQEALPLLLSLLEYPVRANRNQLLIVEEPEAHLFPEAQKYILDLMARAARESSCDLLFTTHSPYVLACLNVHMAKLENEPRPQIREVSITAYLSKGGSFENIVDDDNMIDTNALDGVSEDIANEYLEAIR